MSYAYHFKRSHAFAGALTAVMAVLSGLTGPATAARPCRPVTPIPPDTLDIPKPSPVKRHTTAVNVIETSNAYLLRPFDFARQFKRLNDSLPRALNAGPFGEVPNSSWYTARNSHRRMSLGEIARGPNTAGGPDTSGCLYVFRAKDFGLSPGFSVRDTLGREYVIKFDSRDYGELASGAELISTKILYAAGYWVPENHVTVFDTAKVMVDTGVEFIDQRGRKRTMRRDDLTWMFRQVAVRDDGRVRALASRYIEGEPLGEWRFRGTRRDDPNDFIPHQHRRELRGLRVIGAWINHFDARTENTFDAYVTVNGRSYVRHYLLDFGSTLGASTSGPMWRSYGHENAFDVPLVLLRIITLGFYSPFYMRWDTLVSPAVGTWEARTFDPGAFSYGVPNLAFANMTAADGFWAARVVMSFTDAQIDTIVASARYSDPADAAYVARILKKRRDMIGRYYYDRVNPLGNFRLLSSGTESPELCFDDWAVDAGLHRGAATRYRYAVKVHCGCRRQQRPDWRMSETTCLPLDIPVSSGDLCVVVTVRTLRRGRRPGRDMRAYIRRAAGRGAVLVRIER